MADNQVAEQKDRYSFMGLELHRVLPEQNWSVWATAHDSVPYVSLREAIAGRLFIAYFKRKHDAQGYEMAQGATPEEALDVLSIEIKKLAKFHWWLSHAGDPRAP